MFLDVSKKWNDIKWNTRDFEGVLSMLFSWKALLFFLPWKIFSTMTRLFDIDLWSFPSPGFILCNHILLYDHTTSYWYLQDTQKQQRNELLFQQFGINYKMLPVLFRQGSCLFKTEVIFSIILYLLFPAFACFLWDVLHMYVEI